MYLIALTKARGALAGLILTFACAAASFAAGASLSGVLSHEEFRTLAEQLAPKVNLFRDVWEKNPEAELFGGTTRDYLYWLAARFRGARTHDEALAIAGKLRALKVIDVRDFIAGESDVDVAAPGPRLNLDAEKYGIRKIDNISSERFDPKSELGKSELRQGYIPVEKIRLGRNGFVQAPEFGDGVREIYDGVLSVHFATPDDFKSTYYAKKNLNHPVLLAIRYLRLIAADYQARYGKDYPETDLLRHMSKGSADAVKQVLADAPRSASLAKCMAEPQFVRWLNGSLQKAFRSFTNPTAAKALFDRFGVPRLIEFHPNIEGYNHYLFDRKPEPDRVAENLRTFKAGPEVYGTVKEHFKNGIAYHGTRSIEAFRGIVFQGIIPSRQGTAGKGAYVVPLNNIGVARSFAKDPDWIVELGLKESATVIDITEGSGKTLFEAYAKKQSLPNGSTQVYEDFADAFGADILRYPYDESTAYVVKNGAGIASTSGHTLKLMSLSKFYELAEQVKDAADVDRLSFLSELNNLTLEERVGIFEQVFHSAGSAKAKQAAGEFLGDALGRSIKSENYNPRVKETLAEIRRRAAGNDLMELSAIVSWLRAGKPGVGMGSESKAYVKSQWKPRLDELFPTTDLAGSDSRLQRFILLRGRDLEISGAIDAVARRRLAASLPPTPDTKAAVDELLARLARENGDKDRQTELDLDADTLYGGILSSPRWAELPEAVGWVNALNAQKILPADPNQVETLFEHLRKRDEGAALRFLGNWLLPREFSGIQWSTFDSKVTKEQRDYNHIARVLTQALESVPVEKWGPERVMFALDSWNNLHAAFKGDVYRKVPWSKEAAAHLLAGLDAPAPLRGRMMSYESHATMVAQGLWNNPDWKDRPETIQALRLAVHLPGAMTHIALAKFFERPEALAFQKEAKYIFDGERDEEWVSNGRYALLSAIMKSPVVEKWAPLVGQWIRDLPRGSYHVGDDHRKFFVRPENCSGAVGDLGKPKKKT